jgi:hypothetical protein
MHGKNGWMVVGIPPGQNVMLVSPLVITQANPMTIEGGVILVSGA